RVSLFGIFASLSLMFASFFSVSFSRFAGSFFPAFARASLTIITEGKDLVKQFLEIYFEEKSFESLLALCLLMISTL
ncbi:MAG: hypothetical protein J5653_10180, partial [Clostridiales bacterium]|nr:hypothetical protein [Clostridiales bacterium]